jgi:hypothetical protein
MVEIFDARRKSEEEIWYENFLHDYSEQEEECEANYYPNIVEGIDYFQVLDMEKVVYNPHRDSMEVLEVDAWLDEEF